MTQPAQDGVVRHMTYPITEQILRQRVATKVRELRKQAGLTLQAAAARAEMHLRHWQKVEAAAVSLTLWRLARIAEALNVDPEELIAA